jgi:hypothetical protein
MQQRIKVMELNERRLEGKVEQVLQAAERERRRWEEAMAGMHREVASLNEMMLQMVREKRPSLKCQCKHRVKDLERQVLDLHRELYYKKKSEGEVKAE